jgi:two-component system sensor kinase FixL
MPIYARKAGIPFGAGIGPRLRRTPILHLNCGWPVTAKIFLPNYLSKDKESISFVKLSLVCFSADAGWGNMIETHMDLSAALSIYSRENRRRVLLIAALLAIAIAVLDWRTESYISLGFLYLFPIILVSGFFSRIQITCLAVVLAVLAEVFSNLPSSDAVPRLVLSSAGFIGTGLFIYELVRNRRLVEGHVQELEGQVKLRREAEEQLQIMVESSPAAIITIDENGTILLANEAAQHLFTANDEGLMGQKVQSYLPALFNAVQSKRPRTFRTTLQSRALRQDGEAFLAGVWFSTYNTDSGLRLAAIIVDLSDDLRNREDLSLDYLLKNTRILMSAVAHEIRNLCGAALMVHKNLTRVAALRDNADFEALGSLIHGLEKISAMELRDDANEAQSPIELTSVLDELRILLESSYHDLAIKLHWEVNKNLPLVWADHYGLMQVFLNLAKNSMRAMRNSTQKQLNIRADTNDNSVVVRFEDTGTGIANAENLFRPFQRDAQASGLGLYVSRAIMKSFGGDLVYEPRAIGCAFVIKMRAATAKDEVLHA